MRRVLLSLVVIFLLLCRTYADPRTEALDKEPRLDKHITLRLRASALKNVLAVIQTETGTSLKVARDIAEDKASICVKDKPAREVLAALAHCFNCSWSLTQTKDYSYLRLSMDRSGRAELDRMQNEDDQVILDQADREAETIAKMVRAGVVYNPTAEEMGRLSYADLLRLQQRQTATKDRDIGAMILQYLELTESQRRELLTGRRVIVAKEEMSDDASSMCPSAKWFGYDMTRHMTGCLIHCLKQPGPIECKAIANAYYDDSRYDKRAAELGKALIKDPALSKDLPKPKPAGSKDPQNAASNDLADESWHPSQAPPGSAVLLGSMSDRLMSISDAMDVPFVAQYATEYHGGRFTWDDSTVSYNAGASKKLGELLAERCKEHRFAITREGDMLVAKSLLWHRLRLREVPEDMIKRWQSLTLGLAYPTFDVAVEMAGCTWDQVRGIVDNSKYVYGMDSLAEIARCEYALKLYGALDSKQQSQVQAGKELPIAGLASDKQGIFMQAFEVRPQPTYDQAQDPGWPRRASFSIIERGPAAGWLVAVAGMRILDVEGEELIQPRAETPTISDVLLQKLTKEVQPQIPIMAKLLFERVHTVYPKIDVKDIGIYSTRRVAFKMRLGESTRECELVYCRKEVP